MYEEDNILLREGKWFIVYAHDHWCTEPISFNNLECSDTNYFKKKISTIKFIDMVSMDKWYIIEIMNNLKKAINILEQYNLIEVTKTFSSLWWITPNEFLFSNGVLNTTTQQFLIWKNISQRHK